jgi:galactokinase
MNASQESCRDLFQCSCPELDELTTLARSHGAYGSRLTGAGWGGCTVSLVAPDQVDHFMDSLKRLYYYKNFPNLESEPDRMRDVMFASKPGIGCGSLTMSF